MSSAEVKGFLFFCLCMVFSIGTWIVSPPPSGAASPDGESADSAESQVVDSPPDEPTGESLPATPNREALTLLIGRTLQVSGFDAALAENQMENLLNEFENEVCENH